MVRWVHTLAGKVKPQILKLKRSSEHHIQYCTVVAQVAMMYVSTTNFTSVCQLFPGHTA